MDIVTQREHVKTWCVIRVDEKTDAYPSRYEVFGLGDGQTAERLRETGYAEEVLIGFPDEESATAVAEKLNMITEIMES